MVYIELWRSRLISPASIVNQIGQFSSTLPDLDREHSSLYQSLLKTSRKRKLQEKLQRGIVANDNKSVQSFSTLSSGREDDSVSAPFDNMSVLPLDSDKIMLLQQLESNLSFEDILYFRSLAEMSSPNDIRKETWFGSLIGWATGKPSSQAEEERGKLLEALKYDPDNLFRAGAAQVDVNEVMNIVDVYLKEGSVTFSLSAPDASSTFQSAIPFLQLKLEDLRLKTVGMGDGSHLKVYFSLQDFEGFELQPATVTQKKVVGELVHHRFIFRRTLKVEKSITAGSESNYSLSEDRSVSSSSRQRASGLSLMPLFSSIIEVFPAGNEVEVSVRLDLEELEVWFSPSAKWVDSIVLFSTWPEDLKYWSEMEMKAMNQFEDMKLRLNAKLEYMMNNHSNVVIEGRLQAPIFVIHDHKQGVTCKSNILVADLGLLTLHTQKLAKAQRSKDLLAMSQMQASNINTSAMMNSAIVDSTALPSMVNVADSTERGWNILTSERLHNNNIDDVNLVPKDLDLLFAGVQTEENQSVMDNAFGAGGRRSSIFHKHGAVPLLPDNLEFDSQEEELFDIFICKISHIEVYFVEALVNVSLDGKWNVQYEVDKTVMVERFEINIEIQVSALPWDITLPPVKLFVDIPAINVQLSDAKILRIVQFASQMARQSQAILDATADKSARLKSFRAAKTSDAPLRKEQPISTNRNSKGEEFSSTLQRQQSMRSRRRHKSRGKSFGENSTILSDSKSTVTANTSYTSRSRAPEANAGVAESQDEYKDSQQMDDHDDSDDDSFFSVENNENYQESSKSLEELKFIIAQREAMQTKLLTDLRLTELDPSKTTVQENLKRELAVCEMELHQLKVSYVERLMSDSEYLGSFDEEGNNLEMLDSAYDTLKFKARVDSMMSPDFAPVDPTKSTRKRDLVQASAFKLPSNHTISENEEDGSLNKELLFLKLNIAQVNIDLLCGTDSDAEYAGVKSPSSAFLKRRSASFESRLGLSNFSLKLRHRSQDTRLSTQLRDLIFSEQLAPGPKLSSISKPLIQGGVPLITSDPSYFSEFALPVNSRTYSTSGMTDLLRIKHEISYRARNTEGELTTCHVLKCSLGYLGINVDQARLVPLMLWAQDLNKLLTDNLPSSPPKPSLPRRNSLDQHGEGSDASSSSVPLFPIANISVKWECLSLSWLNGRQPLLNATISATKAQIDLKEHSAVFVLSFVDVSVFDLDSIAQGRFMPSNSTETRCLGSSAMIFGRRVNTASPLLQTILRLGIDEEDGDYKILFKGITKIAPVVVDIRTGLIESSMHQIVQGPLVSALNNMQNPRGNDSLGTVEPDTSRSATITELCKKMSRLHGSIQFIDHGVSLSMHFEDGAKNKAETLSVFVASVSSTWSLGQVNLVSEIEITTKLVGIEVHVSKVPIINPIEVSMLAFLRGDIEEHKMLVSDRYRNFTHYTPDYLPPLTNNEAQVLFSVSPVQLHFHHDLYQRLLALSSKVAYFVSALEKLQKPKVRIEQSPLSKIEVHPAKTDYYLSRLSCKVSTSIKLHEVALILEEKDNDNLNGSCQGANNVGASVHGDYFMAFDNSTRIHPRFALTVSNISAVVLLFDQARDVDVAESSAAKVVKLCIQVKKLVFSDFTSQDQPISILQSGEKITMPIAHTPVNSPILKLKPTALLDDTLFLSGKVTLLSNSVCKASIFVSDVILVAHQGSVTSLIGWINRILNSGSCKIPDYSNKTANASGQSKTFVAEELYAHPSSQPMSPVIEVADDVCKDAEEQSLCLSVVPLDIFSNVPLKSLSMTFELSKFEVLVPFGEESLHAFLFTVPVQASLVFTQPDVKALEDVLLDFSRSNIDILGCQVLLPEVSLFLLEGAVVVGDADDSMTRKTRTPLKNSRSSISGSLQFTNRKLLMHTDCQVSQSTYFSCRPWLAKSDDDISKTSRDWLIASTNDSLFLHSRVTIDVKNFELRAYIDCRPLLKFHEDYFVPLQQIVEHVRPEEVSAMDEVEVHNSSVRSEKASAHQDSSECQAATSLGDFLKLIANVSSLEIMLKLGEANVIVINDALPQALALLQICALDTSLAVCVPALPRPHYWLLLKCHPVDAISTIAHIKYAEHDDTVDKSPLFSSRLLAGESKGGGTVGEFFITKESSEPVFIMAQFGTAVSVDYFNQKLLAVEPLIEPVDVRSSLRVVRSIYEQHRPVVFVINSEHSTYYETEYNLLRSTISALDVKHQPKLLQVTSDILTPQLSAKLGKVNVNVTMGLIETGFLCAQSVDLLMGKFGANVSNSQGNMGSSLIIRNESGVPVRYWTSYVMPTTLDSNTEEWITSDEVETQGLNVQKLIALNKSPVKSISLALQRFDGTFSSSHNDIPLEGVGFRVLNFDDNHGIEESTKKAERTSKRRSRSNTSDRLSMPTPPLVLELSSRDGSKLLIVRSTMRVYNASNQPFVVRMVESKPYPKQPPMWECFLPPGKGQFVPAELCALSNTYLIISVRIHNEKERMVQKRGSAYFACPPIPGFSGHAVSSAKTDSKEVVAASVATPLSNDTIRRKKLVQEEATVNVMTYSHWISFDSLSGKNSEDTDMYQKLNDYAERICCNVEVESKGMPFKKQASPSPCMIRDVKILPPVAIVNLLGTGVTVALTPELETLGYSGDMDRLLEFDCDLQESITQDYLRSGEAKEYFCFHARDPFFLSVKYVHDNNSAKNHWSKFIKVPACPEEPLQSPWLFSTDIAFKNDSVLTINVEVIDKGGCRTVNIYAPFWVVSTSFLPLQLQHEVKTSSKAEKFLNGIDGLAADQVFESSKFNSFEETKGNKNVSKPTSLPKGIGRARGLNGVILGPEAPIKGLSDVLYTGSKVNIVSKLQKPPISGTQLMRYETNDQVALAADQQQAVQAGSLGSELGGAGRDSMDTWYSLVHCGYTNKEKKTARVRFKHLGTQWSKFISLENDGIQTITVDGEHATSHEADSTGSYSVNSPFFKEGKKLFTFGVSIQALDPPFHRTQAIVVMDNYSLVNMVGQSLEVKQFQQDNVFTMHQNEEVPLWWRPGKQLLQLRLARYGWSWSGKFSAETEGEFYLRLRNDYDHTVFFVLIYVVRNGPKITIIFKGGDKTSPYRFENHTVETFRIQQKDQSQLSNLLPYHACSYAWDEPLAPQMFTISILKNALQAQDDWEVVGTFTFERLAYMQSTKKYEHLVMRIVAQGPTRVFQIYDSRLGSSSYQHKTEKTIGQKLRWMSSYDNILNSLLEIDGIGVSAVDQTPEELIYLSLQGLSVKHSLFRNEAATTLSVKRFQLDNQLWSTPYPSIIHPLVPWSAERSTNESVKVEVRQSFDYSGIVFLPELSISIAPFDINVEGTIVAKLISMAFNCLEAFTEVSTPLQVHNTGKYRFGSSKLLRSDDSFTSYDNLDALSSSPFILGSTSKTLNYRLIQRVHYLLYKYYYAAEDGLSGFSEQHLDPDGGRSPLVRTEEWRSGFHDTQSLPRYFMLSILRKFRIDPKVLQPTTKIYFQRFELSEIRFNFSLNPVVNSDTSVATEAAPLIIGALSRVLIAIGSSVAKIDNCPLRFSSITLEHVFASSKGFGDVIVKTYALQAVKQAHMVVLSSELLGNPVQLFQSLSEGVWDFIHLPTVGLLSSPEDFALGVLRGSSSLVRNVVASCCATAGHLMNSLQVGLIALGAVDSYPVIDRDSSGDANNRDNNSKTSSPAGALSVVEKRRTYRPASSLEAMRMAITGLVTDPMAGFQTDGVRGFVIGFAKGGVGLFARPLYGILGAGCLTMEQVSFRLLPRYLANQKLRLTRARPPRYFLSPTIPLQIYSADENKGLEILAKLQQGAYRHEEYLWHGHTVDNRSILLTKVRVLILQENFEVLSVTWQCLVKHILSLELDYSSSRPTEVDTSHVAVAQNMRVLMNMIESDSLSASKQTQDRMLAGFKSKLSGQPSLSLYHLPQSDHNNRYVRCFFLQCIGRRKSHV
ncbi:hypothetical protein EON65_00390 [archaeon]|nr:MAG: hypothetical protein EON65_00390 [archaeon]